MNKIDIARIEVARWGKTDAQPDRNLLECYFSLPEKEAHLPMVTKGERIEEKAYKVWRILESTLYIHTFVYLSSSSTLQDRMRSVAKRLRPKSAPTPP